VRIDEFFTPPFGAGLSSTEMTRFLCVGFDLAPSGPVAPPTVMPNNNAARFVVFFGLIFSGYGRGRR
jgi:hypothetical protein